MFQSPQWGSNSKANYPAGTVFLIGFQSPQWGSNSKVEFDNLANGCTSFSPRNGEVILKVNIPRSRIGEKVSVPAMGK